MRKGPAQAQRRTETEEFSIDGIVRRGHLRELIEEASRQQFAGPALQDGSSRQGLAFLDQVFWHNVQTAQHRVAQYLLIKDLKRLLKTETDAVVMIPSLFSSLSI